MQAVGGSELDSQTTSQPKQLNTYQVGVTKYGVTIRDPAGYDSHPCESNEALGQMGGPLDTVPEK